MLWLFLSAKTAEPGHSVRKSYCLYGAAERGGTEPEEVARIRSGVIPQHGCKLALGVVAACGLAVCWLANIGSGALVGG